MYRNGYELRHEHFERLTNADCVGGRGNIFDGERGKPLCDVLRDSGVNTVSSTKNNGEMS